jgi:hypothetical protein
MDIGAAPSLKRAHTKRLLALPGALSPHCMQSNRVLNRKPKGIHRSRPTTASMGRRRKYTRRHARSVVRVSDGARVHGGQNCRHGAHRPYESRGAAHRHVAYPHDASNCDACSHEGGYQDARHGCVTWRMPQMASTGQQELLLLLKDLAALIFPPLIRAQIHLHVSLGRLRLNAGETTRSGAFSSEYRLSDCYCGAPFLALRGCAKCAMVTKRRAAINQPGGRRGRSRCPDRARAVLRRRG